MFYVTTQKLIIAGVVGAAMLVCSFFIGILSVRSHDKPNNNLEFQNRYVKDDNLPLVEQLTEGLKVDNMKKHLDFLTSIPHLAGTIGDKITADYVYNQWKLQGLDSVQMIDYDVLLDYPDDYKFNNIQIRDEFGEIEDTFEIKETVYDSDLDYTNISKPFLAFGLNGSVTTDEVYYANHCDIDDFDLLAKNGINVTGKIVLCKYGMIFRGNKVKIAELYGAKGVLLFDDPSRSAPRNASNKIYPYGDFLPKDGVQRGSLNSKEGDPLTPVYPSIKSSYKSYENEKKVLPNIPAQVIGYGLAADIFNMIDGFDNVPSKWKGELNATYTFGGKLKDKRKLTLNVYNQRKIAKIYNVLGIIRGSVEPDRYILIGNHRDAWTWGAIDPNSGTAVLLELTRNLMNLKNAQNWNPKRSVIFLSWSGEEYGTIGSTEWVEEFRKKLSANGVLYINIDNIIKGDYALQIKASPLTFDVLYQISQTISLEGKTLYDSWLDNEPNESKTLPRISPYLGSGTDHVSFLQKAGIACIDQRFIRNNKDPLYAKIIGSYPLYHSSYDTSFLVNSFVDPGFKVRKIMGVFTGEVLRAFSSPLIVPFNTQTYANELLKEFDKFKLKFNAKFESINITLDDLENSIKSLIVVATDFNKRLSLVDKKESNIIRQFNDQLANFERAFLDPSTLFTNGYMHMIFAPSSFNKYSALGFPTLADALYEYEKNNKTSSYLEKIKYKLSIIVYTMQSAISILNDPLDFQRRE